MVRQSVGTGLRWASPIGPVALDFALPLNDQQATPAVLISVGDSF
jgi:outer membrane translocation and assembly module TamA